MTSPDEPKRRLGGLASWALVAGSMVGAGIFIFPPFVAAAVASPLAFLGLWAFGGLTAYAGAVAYAELGAMIPRAGGEYVFQREAYGAPPAVATGWVLFVAIMCGSVASLAVAVSTYQLPGLLGVDLKKPLVAGVTGVQVAAIALVLALTVLNSLGVRLIAAVQTMLTLGPLVVLYLLSGAVLFAPPAAGAWDPKPLAGGITAIGLVDAYLKIYFAYSGWPQVVYVAGEVDQPGKNLPRALLLGVAAVTALYLAMCAAFINAVGLDGLRAAAETWTDAGTATMRRFSPEATRLVLALIAIPITATLNATIFAGARIAYAMARGGYFWRATGELDARTGIPLRALWLQAAIGVVFILSGVFEALLNMASLAMVLTGSLTVLAVHTLRKQRPAAERPYRVPAYPVWATIYLGSSAVVIAIALLKASQKPREAWIEPLGLVLYVVAVAGLTWRQRRKRTAQA